MENATKALIIAGAILVSILLVTMGITLLNGVGGIQGQQDSVSNEITVKSFNDQFTAAIGNNVRGEKVQELIEKVALKKIDDPGIQLDIEYGDGLEESKIRATSRYDVEAEKDGAGYICKIKISKPKKSSTGG